ncbi:hypothetical protein WJX74_009241 [Apatococcus lobatus]|uniref:Uncharacterized protein n=1 Tax=Apatococcus lobatus TaxID=904363 RepID=A0AAW1QMW7_9CHLO
MLVLCVHTVPEVTAKVPFAMVMLMDKVRKRDVPVSLRCRQVIPTSGNQSTSMWDVPSIDELQEWLGSVCGGECASEIYEVQEDFAYGISTELTRVRTADRVAANARATTAAANKQMSQLDQKYHVSETTSAISKAAREKTAAAAQNTSALLSRWGLTARTQAGKAMENERVANVSTTVNSGVQAGWKSLGEGIGYLRGKSGSSQSGTPPSAASPPATTTHTFSDDRPRSAANAPSDGGSLMAASNLEGKASSGSQSNHTSVAAPVEVPSSPTEDKVFTLDDLDSEDGGSPKTLTGAEAVSAPGKKAQHV